MNLFISISARKEKSKYKLFKLYVRKYFTYSYTETVNGIFIKDYEKEPFDIISKLKEDNGEYIITDKPFKDSSLKFAFFELLSYSGEQTLKKSKDYLLKYAIYPTIVAFKSTKENNLFIHFPTTPSNTSHLAFSFDLHFSSFGLSTEKEVNFKNYIENQIRKRLFGKKIIK